MSNDRRRVKQKVDGMREHLEWCVTHAKSIGESFEAYTNDLMAMSQDPNLTVDEDTLNRYLAYTTRFKELEELFAQLIDLVVRIRDEI